MRTRRPFLSGLVAIGLLACASQPPNPKPAVVVEPVAGVAVPDTAAGRQLAWVLAALKTTPTETEAALHFEPTFLAKVPAAKVVALFAQVASGAPFVLESVSPGKSPEELLATVRSARGTGETIRLAIVPSTGRMHTLWLRPAAEIPDTAEGRQLRWVLGALATPPSEADVASHFAPEFLAAVPVAQLVATIGTLAPLGPLVLESAAPGEPGVLLAVVRQRDNSRVNITLTLDASGRMRGLAVQPHLERKHFSSWDEVRVAARAVAPKVGFLAAELDADKCTPIASLEPSTPLALGSAFKLYILDALAAQVASGKHTWDESLPIQDALKSLPSGSMRNEPAGKTFSIRHYAEQMISVSDNTAADHLLTLVGRSAAEDAARSSGHASPGLLQPFLTTRELFALKLLATPDERAAYVGSDTPHRRTLLDAYRARDLAPAMAQAASFTKPVMIDTLEWFASPVDLCHEMASLKARAAAPSTAAVRAILSMNPGIPSDKKQYSYVGYKGGSEPGVLNVTWLLQRARDEKWLFLTFGFNDVAAAIDEPKAEAIAAGALELLGQ